jgi:hypothetical protein
MLGYRTGAEVIFRNDMVCIKSQFKSERYIHFVLTIHCIVARFSLSVGTAYMIAL